MNMKETEKLTEIDLAEMAKKAPARDAYSSVVDFALLIDRLKDTFNAIKPFIHQSKAIFTPL